MDKIIIEGGVPLRGEVNVSGSKNASLPCLFAALLTDDDCVIENVPNLVDIDTTCLLLSYLGKKIERENHTVFISAGKKIKTEAPYELVRKMRASALVLGPLLARFGKASASLPGGCAIGVRPINIHLAGFEALGAKSELSEGMVRLEAKKLKGCKIKLDFPSVGATENLLMAGVFSEGETVIENVAREPEIIDLADFLSEMGADISGAGTKKIKVKGVQKLRGICHKIIPDRIETATYLIAAAATKGNLKLNRTNAGFVRVILDDLKKSGFKIDWIENGKNEDSIHLEYQGKIKPVNVETEVYPGFPTDVQAQWMALMSLAEGESVICETIFENRFLHAAELLRMGAKIEIKDNQAFVTGVKQLSGAEVMVSDLRAGAAMVIAGLAAAGESVVHRIYHLDRGYEDLELKLKKLGARIKRIH